MRILNQENLMTQERLEAINQALANETMSKGAAIRECFANGMSVKEISTATNILYNHCYNVANQEVLKHRLEVERTRSTNGITKKSQILELREQGKTLAEISKELGVLYNQVWQVCNKAGLTDKQLEATTVAQEPVVEAAPEQKKGKKAKVA